MGDTAFVVWRESVEALLVIGVLFAWLRERDDARRALRYLWGGVAAGVGLAVVLAAVMMAIQTELAGTALGYFQTGVMLVAAALIVQMVLWMRLHGRTLKRDMEQGLSQAAVEANWWGVAILAALAVAREGSEMVVFLYGVVLAQGPVSRGTLLLGVALGAAAAFVTFWLLSRGRRWLPWRLFFTVTEVLLLLLGAALVINGVDKLLGMGVIDIGLTPLWDSSALLSDGGTIGGLVSSFTGYRARPDLAELCAYGAYWLLVFGLLRLVRRGRDAGAQAVAAGGSGVTP